MKSDTLDYFESISDDDLIMLASLDWEALEAFCMLLTLDIEVQSEQNNSQILN